jgi:hypothetical protein
VSLRDLGQQQHNLNGARVGHQTVMLSAAKHLALLFLGRKVQSEILRSAPLRSE